LNQLAQQWSTNQSYFDRILLVHNSQPSLGFVTVFGDFSTDVVFGGADLDWFFFSRDQDTSDAQSNEVSSALVFLL
jgi:hypothetical protein